MRRPSPALVVEIVQRLTETVDAVTEAAVVAAIQRETGCSRATAYRAFTDAIVAGTIESA